MERYTMRAFDGEVVMDCAKCHFNGPEFCTRLVCRNRLKYRLAAYEDTGLTPERVAELAQAEQDGRLSVLPESKAGILHTTHEVKTLPEYFWPQVSGRKPFEVRRDDRGYQVGDILRQREWTSPGGYTGAVLDREITYVLRDPEYVKEGYAVLGLKEIDRK